MTRTPTLVMASVTAVLLLAACASPAPSSDETDPAVVASATPTPDPNANGGDAGWPPCAGANLDNFTASIDGVVQLAPNDGDYPPYMPAPSCIAYPTDQGISIAEFLGATQSDYEDMEAGVVNEQGAGAPGGELNDILQADETWPSGGVIDLRFVAASDGFDVDRIEATSVVANYTPGG